MVYKIDFAKKKSKSDEWYTPKSAVSHILSYLKPNSKILSPFDTKDSNFIKILNDAGHKVVYTHIKYGYDFFDLTKKQVAEYDYIISNPPYSKRNEILIKLYELEKPFAMLMNTNGLFDSSIRWNLFKSNNFCLIYLKGRVNYMKEYGLEEKSSPPFQSAYITNGLSNNQIEFSENTHK
ncbi:MAG: hypothetical protein OEV44_00825 [Spirochaetota bacterium]|nr:hypothetical protein [Spirochaetota bacterium]